MLSANDPRVVFPDDPQRVAKVVIIGYGVAGLCCLLAPGKLLKHPLVILPNVLLLLGLLAPLYLQGVLMAVEENANPFEWRAENDPLCIVRLFKWYNYEAIDNPIGGPLVNAFAILGMLFAGKGGNFTILRTISLAAVAGIHLKWAFETFKPVVLGESTMASVGGTFYADAMLAQNPTKPYPGLHDGVMGYMPASYTVDYLSMVAVALTFVLFEAEGVMEKIKALVVTVLFGGSAGLLYACGKNLLPSEDKPSRPLVGLVYLVVAAASVYVWLPFQMSWIDNVVTASGRLNGGLINHDASYCTMSVILPYFAIVAIAVAHYHRQDMPTIQKGLMYFNASAFLFFHIAFACAVMMGMSCIWGTVGDPAVKTTTKDKKRK